MYLSFKVTVHHRGQSRQKLKAGTESETKKLLECLLTCMEVQLLATFPL